MLKNSSPEPSALEIFLKSSLKIVKNISKEGLEKYDSELEKNTRPDDIVKYDIKDEEALKYIIENKEKSVSEVADHILHNQRGVDIIFILYGVSLLVSLENDNQLEGKYKEFINDFCDKVEFEVLQEYSEIESVVKSNIEQVESFFEKELTEPEVKELIELIGSRGEAKKRTQEFSLKDSLIQALNAQIAVEKVLDDSGNYKAIKSHNFYFIKLTATIHSSMKVLKKKFEEEVVLKNDKELNQEPVAVVEEKVEEVKKEPVAVVEERVEEVEKEPETIAPKKAAESTNTTKEAPKKPNIRMEIRNILGDFTQFLAQNGISEMAVNACLSVHFNVARVGASEQEISDLRNSQKDGLGNVFGSSNPTEKQKTALMDIKSAVIVALNLVWKENDVEDFCGQHPVFSVIKDSGGNQLLASNYSKKKNGVENATKDPKHASNMKYHDVVDTLAGKFVERIKAEELVLTNKSVSNYSASTSQQEEEKTLISSSPSRPSARSISPEHQANSGSRSGS